MHSLSARLWLSLPHLLICFSHTLSKCPTLSYDEAFKVCENMIGSCIGEVEASQSTHTFTHRIQRYTLHTYVYASYTEIHTAHIGWIKH